MTSDREHPTTMCSADIMPRCPHGFKDSGRWARIKAGGEGWFFPRDGGAFCPDHVPDWVPAWRERKAQQMMPVAERIDAKRELYETGALLLRLSQRVDPDQGQASVRRGDLAKEIGEITQALGRLRASVRTGVQE